MFPTASVTMTSRLGTVVFNVLAAMCANRPVWKRYVVRCPVSVLMVTMCKGSPSLVATHFTHCVWCCQACCNNAHSVLPCGYETTNTHQVHPKNTLPMGPKIHGTGKRSEATIQQPGISRIRVRNDGASDTNPHRVACLVQGPPS